MDQSRTGSPVPPQFDCHLPDMPTDPGWIVAVEGVDRDLEMRRDVRLALAAGTTGTLAGQLVDFDPAEQAVYVAGVYSGVGTESRLLRLPGWTGLAGQLDESSHSRRVLDMRTGLLHHELVAERGPIRAVSFASRARTGIGALRARGPGVGPADAVPGTLVPSLAEGVALEPAEWWRGRGESRCLDRIVAVHAGSSRLPGASAARALQAQARALGFDGLVEEQRAEWAARWADAGITIEGDPEMDRAVRFALFQLMAHEVERGESAIGARGVTGPKYRGHVFWDTDVYVLPFFAATNPRAARAVLEYRIRRLPAARAAARAADLAGARFPWESAADGVDVTPASISRPDDAPLEVLTGPYELHITADVAWAAATYFDWTGDLAFARGPGAELMFETARYWASRIEQAPDGSAHITNVTGPDEYHNHVSDNAYTNVMARWNLRRAAEWVDGAAPERAPGHASPAERSRWRDVADRLADGFDQASGVYEQFDGYFGLDPVKIAELAARPLSGEVFLGRDRVEATQCVKQPDVLMLYQLIPDELRPGTLEANVDFYDPRTSHGSTLSPGIHAALLARAGRPEEALAALRMIAFVDLDDASRGTAEGLHMAALGSIWQAIAMGFAGLRLTSDGLALDPHLPAAWQALEVPARIRGRRVHIRVEHERLRVWAQRRVVIRVAGLDPIVVGRGGIDLARRGGRWT